MSARFAAGDGEGFLGAAIGGLLALGAAALFWRAAVRRFDNEGT
jgi:hypothetical protein